MKDLVYQYHENLMRCHYAIIHEHVVPAALSGSNLFDCMYKSLKRARSGMYNIVCCLVFANMIQDWMYSSKQINLDIEDEMGVPKTLFVRQVQREKPSIFLILAVPKIFQKWTRQ